MAPSKKPGGQATPAEVALVQLKNCLVNLPSALVSVLLNANTAAQNVVVELTYRSSRSSSSSASSSSQKSVYVGWTGMPSKRKLAPIVGRDGLNGSRNTGSSSQQEVALVEIDNTFAQTLGLDEGQKVGILLHLDPPIAHTVNIEPLTPADWEIIELHATFLELNLLSQIRALPNPSYNHSSAGLPQGGHPLTLHLSPTSTASIIVTSLLPPISPSSPFAKISPDAEVIVAPKTRQKSSRSNDKESRSVASTSRRSAGGRSGVSAVRKKEDSSGKAALFFRGVDRGVGGEWFEDEEDLMNQGLRVWLDRDVLASKILRGVDFVKVTLVKPAGLQVPIETQQQPQGAQGDASSTDAIKPSPSVIARVSIWDDGPDSQHVALSSELCSSLGSEGMVGGIVRIEAAPPQLTKSAVKSLKVYPFVPHSSIQSEGLRFGSETKAEREESSNCLRSMYGRTEEDKRSLLDGPLTDGMALPSPGDNLDARGWSGGIIKFDPPVSQNASNKTSPLGWLLGSELRLTIDVQAPIPRPQVFQQPTSGGQINSQRPTMVGIDTLIGQLMGHLTHSSSALVAGGMGSGKTSLAHHISHRLKNEYLFHTEFFPCQKLVTDETRVSSIKETINRLFMAASWGARPTGRAVVILDDLDKLCPVETELQVGGENGRSRQISEVICAIVRNYCTAESGVVLLATASSKESLNNVIIGGHVIREITALKAPDKEGRRRILELLALQDSARASTEKMNGHGSGHKKEDGMAWMDGSSTGSRPTSSNEMEGFVVDRNLDFLHLAGQTDGYMPGDLVLLVSRARNEALIRSLEHSGEDNSSSTIELGQKDFERALKGFTPASLRNVTLQTSTTTFDSIGGLHATRKTLLETLQYPTTYAPIFAQCPLRLRSGLLLYGYPGCGKTLLASAVAGECGLNFISVKGPEILNKYIGASEKSVRDLFERAEAARPCVLFFDEFDSIAPKRGHDSTGVTDRVVNQLLTQMDGAEGLTGVYVLAATSRPDLIDPALLRPGRLDKSLLCDLPSFDDRIDILRALSKKLKLADDVLNPAALHDLARMTDGYSGADLQAVVSNAQLESIHEVLDLQAQEAEERGVASRSRKGKPEKGRSTGHTRDFLQFRFGAEEDEKEARERSMAGTNRSKQLAEAAAIAAKLEAIKVARRNARLAQRGETVADAEDAANGAQEGKKERQVVIKWKHVIKAVETTKSSISAQERRRLKSIYREFVVGRNGEMPSGQGPTEVGGRSSLM